MYRCAISSFLTVIAVTLGIAQAPRSGFETQSAELRQGGRVTILAIAPLYEDLWSAVYLRQVFGVKVQLVYVTNGEAMTGASVKLYPNQMAADLRGRAYAISRTLDAEHGFLNLSHVDAAANQEYVRSAWDDDTVRSRLYAVFADFKPDLVLVNGLERPETSPHVGEVLLENLKVVLERLRSEKRNIPSVVAIAGPPLSGSSKNVKTAKLTRGRSSALHVATSVRAKYGDLAGFIPPIEAFYTTLPGYPKDRLRNVMDNGRLLRVPRPSTISAIDSIVRKVALLLDSWRSVPRGRAGDRALKVLVAALGEIDAWTDGHPRATELERRILLDWRWSLESVRLKIIGAVPYVRVSDSVLTAVQLVYLTIDSVRGLDPRGQTQVIFPKAKEGWILNERPGDRAAFVTGEPYRLISPRSLALDLPRDIEGLERPVYASPWHLFIVHWATIKERSFSLRVDAGFLGAPRFSVEVMTPIAMAVNGERIAVRITNQSRDGVRDSVAVRLNEVWSDAAPFRLNTKGSQQVDTLTLKVSPEIPDGTHFVNVTIGSDPVAGFLLRKFPLLSDTSHSVVVVAADSFDAASMAIRRTAMSATWVIPSELERSSLPVADVVLISEFASEGISRGGWSNVRSYVEQGGRLVVLAQRPGPLQNLPGEPQLSIAPSAKYDTSAKLSIDSLDLLSASPNDLKEESWMGWLYRRTMWQVQTSSRTVVVQAWFGERENPAILRWHVGHGTVTYVNMNLGHQFLNVLPAAHQLLANLLAN